MEVGVTVYTYRLRGTSDIGKNHRTIGSSGSGPVKVKHLETPRSVTALTTRLNFHSQKPDGDILNTEPKSSGSREFPVDTVGMFSHVLVEVMFPFSSTV